MGLVNPNTLQPSSFAILTNANPTAPVTPLTPTFQPSFNLKLL